MSQINDWKLGNLHDMLEALKVYGSAGPRASVDRGKRAIVIGAMSQDQIIQDACEVWIDGNHTEESDYHKEMKSENFEEWLQRSIPKFQAVSEGRPIVIVMDNASYHSRCSERPPRASDNKKTIAAFLLDHGVLDGSIEENISGTTKKELVASMKNFIEENGGKMAFSKRVVETICSENGVEVMNLFV